VAGTTQILQRISLGKPAPESDGMIRASFAQSLTNPPVPGTSYDAQIITVGPQGSSASTRSNTFTFSSCQYTLSSSSASVAATGGTGSVSVGTSASWCAWTASSSAAWLQITGGAAGTGAGTTTFSAAPNTTGVSRSASITFGLASFTVSQTGGTQTLDVTTEADLQAAIATLASNTTLRLGPGTYRLSSTLQIRGPLSGIVLKGSTGKASDVVLEGQGMGTDGTAATALSVSGAVQGLRIADLTIQNVYRHAVLLDNGPQAPQLSNLRLINCGDACVKANLTSGLSVDDGVVTSSWIGYSTTGASAAAGGIDLRGSQRWKVIANTFQNVRGPNGQSSRAAVSASGGAADTAVERNQFMNISTAIAFGLVNLTGGTDHARGRIVNNFVFRDAAVPGGPAISVVDSPASLVLHNTTVLSKTYAAPIEYRYGDAANVQIANNLLDGAITARDGASATLSGNVTTATTDMFVNPASGDLHLRSTAVGAIDMADVSDQEGKDFDGDSRPMGLAPDVGADEVSSVNAPPTVQVTSPASGAAYRTPASIPLEAQAQDTDGSIVSVEFYVNNTLVGRDTAAPYSMSWTATRNGTYSIVAVATDNAGTRASSQPVTISANKKGR